MFKRTCLLALACLAACVLVSGCFLFPDQAPVAAFVPIYNVLPGDPMVVDLDASGSSDPDGDTIVQYSWAFSDDLTLVEPLAFSATVDHPVLRIRCPNEGQYTVTLLVVSARDGKPKASEPLVGSIVVPQPAP